MTPMTANARSLTFRVARILLLLLATMLFMMTTHPTRVPAMLLVAPFMALFIALYYIALEAIRFFQPTAAEDSASAPVYRPRLLAALLAGFPVLLLVLQSIMELNHWDVLIALAIFLLAYVFISRGALPAGR